MCNTYILIQYAYGRASHIGGKSCYTYKMGKIHDLITLKGYSLKTMHSRYIRVYIYSERV